jgi:hypothetical protein
MIQVKTIAEAKAAHPPVVQRVRKPRHFSRPLAAWFTALLLSLSMAAFVAFAYFAAVMYLTGQPQIGYSALIALGTSLFLRLIAAYHASRLVCNLCHGTVMREKRCLKHHEASKWPLLGYSKTAALSILLCWRFTCMYCGTPYRLKK